MTSKDQCCHGDTTASLSIVKMDTEWFHFTTCHSCHDNTISWFLCHTAYTSHPQIGRTHHHTHTTHTPHKHHTHTTQTPHTHTHTTHTCYQLAMPKNHPVCCPTQHGTAHGLPKNTSLGMQMLCTILHTQHTHTHTHTQHTYKHTHTVLCSNASDHIGLRTKITKR